MSEMTSNADFPHKHQEQRRTHGWAGVNRALAVPLERYYRLVFSIAFKIVRDRDEAEDVTQTIFLDIYSSIAQADPYDNILGSAFRNRWSMCVLHPPTRR